MVVLFDVPRLYANERTKTKLRRLPLLEQEHAPPFWCPWGIGQTVVRQLIKTCPQLVHEREILRFEDGGQVALDWFGPETSRTIVVVLPGLTGSTFESYTLHAVETIVKRLKCRAVVFNNRGNAGCELLTPKTYNAAYTGDLAEVVRHLRREHEGARLVGLGFSLGGMVLFNYVSKCESKADCGFETAVVVSSPWNPMDSTKTLEEFWPRVLFNQRLAQSLCAGVERHMSLFENAVDVAHVLKSGLIREFDERFIVPQFGYRSVEEYYHDAAFFYKVHHVCVPTLCLNSADDCFAPLHSIPFADIESSANVAVVVTAHGGHLGFLANEWWPNGAGFVEELVAEYIDSFVNETSDA